MPYFMANLNFWSDMPHNCNLTRFYVDKVVDHWGYEWCNSTFDCSRNYSHFLYMNESDGNLTVLNTSIAYDKPLAIYVYACSALNCYTGGSLNTINLTIAPFFTYNYNVPPSFVNVTKNRLENSTVYIGRNYHNVSIPLPEIYDYEDNNVDITVNAGKERVFVYLDKASRSWKFWYRTIDHELRGEYNVRIELSDDNWIGSRSSVYYKYFIVDYAPNTTFYDVYDTSSIGGKVADIGLTGKVALAFNVPMFVNPAYWKSDGKRNLQDYCGGWNTTGNTFLCRYHDKVAKPDELLFNPADIDDRILDVYVDPALQQDPSKVNLTWEVETLTESELKLQIVYLNYEEISVEGTDTLVIAFKVNDAFLSQNDSS